ncbi:MAG TPA: MFS transporter [bacterium]|nr:MFS transporter [bacterium]
MGGRWHGINRTLIRVAAIVGTAELGFATVIPLLPLYLKERLGASATLVGVVVATFAAVETVFKTTWGSLADRIGRRPVIVGGLFLSSTAPILMTLLRHPWLFVPLRLVDGMGSAALWPVAAAMMLDRADGEQRATAMGTLNMFFLSGLALGPALGLFVAGYFGEYTFGFYLASVLLLTAALFALAVFRDLDAPPRAVHRGATEPSAIGFIQVVRASPWLLSMLFVAFVQMFGVGLLAPILVIYAHEVVQLSDQLIGTLFLIMVLAVALASVPGGRLADRVGRSRSVGWGMVAASCGMWLLPFAGRGNLPLLAVAALLLGGSYAISSPAWLALMSETAPPGSTGMVMGASETAQGAGLVIGPLLGGILYDALGPQAPFVGSAVLLSAGTIFAVTVLRRRQASPLT